MPENIFRLPRLKTLDRIVDNLGRPSIAFVKFLNTDFAGSIERQEQRQTEILDQLQEVVDALAQAVADIQAAMAAAVAAQQTADAAQEAVVAVGERVVELEDQTGGLFEQAITISEATQVAQATANLAQAAADAAAGGSAISGSATDPAIDLIDDGVWVSGPTVTLTGIVAAGELKLTGSGPQQDADVSLSGGIAAVGEFRLVEVVGGVDEVLVTGQFSVRRPAAGGTPVVLNQSAEEIAAFVSARTSTGSVSYRVDALKTSGAAIHSMALYVFARRAA